MKTIYNQLILLIYLIHLQKIDKAREDETIKLLTGMILIAMCIIGALGD